MDSKIKRKARGVAIFIVFLALATTMITFSRKDRKSPEVDFRASNLKYDNYRIINKARVQFRTDELVNAKLHIENVIANLASKSIEQTDQPAHGVYLFVINKPDLNPILTELQQKGSIVSKSTTTDTSFVNLDFGAETERLKSYEKEMQDLNQLRFPSEVQIRRKETLHGLIGESRGRLDRLQEVDKLLLYITVTTGSSAKKGILALATGLISSFGKWLVVYVVATILIYYGTKLLMTLLALMGIKGIGFGDANIGSYYSNYKSYSGRYNYKQDKKRKTKRIYKEKPTTEDKEKKDTP